MDQKCGKCIHVTASPYIYTNTTFLEWILIVMNWMQFPDMIYNTEMFPSLYDKTNLSDVRATFGDSCDHTIGSLFQNFFQWIKDIIKDYITGSMYGFPRDQIMLWTVFKCHGVVMHIQLLWSLTLVLLITLTYYILPGPHFTNMI